MLNRYAAKCETCHATVAPGEGTIRKVGGKWLTAHTDDVVCTTAMLEAHDREAAPAPARAEIEVGFYRVGESVYRVRPARAGTHNYAMLLEGTEADGKPIWKYAPVMRKIASEGVRLTVDEAAEYGVTHGYCLVCSRLLTDPESMARGIGPVCAGKV